MLVNIMILGRIGELNDIGKDFRFQWLFCFADTKMLHEGINTEEYSQFNGRFAAG
jgi:hypothetical protein